MSVPAHLLRPATLWALLWLAALPAPGRDRGLVAPDGELRPAVVDDFAPHPSDAGGYTEMWSYHAYLGDGLEAHVNLSRANLPSFKGQVCGGQLSLLGLDRRNWAVAREYPAERLAFDAARGRLAVHRNIWAEGLLPERHRLHYETTKDDVAYLVDLTFSAIEPGWVWGDGRYHFGADQAISIFVHIPRARVEGTVRVEDRRSRDAAVVRELPVAGVAYMDHTVFSSSPSKLLRGGYRWLRLDPDYRVGYLLHEDDRGDRALGQELRRTAAGEVTLRPLTGVRVVDSDKLAGAPVARTLAITVAGGGDFRLARSRDREQLSAFGELAGVVKWFARRFAGGELFLFRGDGRIDHAGGVAEDVRYSFYCIK